MATYAVGDVQGCFETLQALVARCGFDPTRDKLWLVGDLVNRGPRSADVLRYAKSLGDRAVCVLGNHDLHLIARHLGHSPAKDLDTLDDVLRAPDATALVDWLASRPLLHQEGGWVMVHAGLAPQWSLEDAAKHARRFEASLKNPIARAQLLAKGGFPPELRVLTTIRTCHPDGSLCRYSGAPEQAPAGCVPWFSHPARRTKGTRVVFGHWAALGLREGPDWLALDSGCVWGNALTAVRLEDHAVFQEPTHESVRVKDST